jgi:hypothetical protein
MYRSRSWFYLDLGFESSASSSCPLTPQSKEPGLNSTRLLIYRGLVTSTLPQANVHIRTTTFPYQAYPSTLKMSVQNYSNVYQAKLHHFPGELSSRSSSW